MESAEPDEMQLPHPFEELRQQGKYPSPAEVAKFLAGFRVGSDDRKPYRPRCTLAEAKRVLKLFPLDKVIGQYGRVGYNVYNYTARGLNVPEITRALRNGR